MSRWADDTYSLEEGHIFYARLGDSPYQFWRTQQQKFYDEADSVLSSLSSLISLTSAGEALLAMAAVERENEHRFLVANFGSEIAKDLDESLSDYPEFIKKINCLMRTEKKLRAILRSNLRDLTGKTEKQRKEDRYERAAGTFFADEVFRKYTEIGYERFKYHSSEASWVEDMTNRLTNAIGRALNSTIKHMAKIDDEVEGEVVQIWRELEEIKNDPHQLDAVKREFSKQFNIEDLLKRMYRYRTGSKKYENFGGMRNAAMDFAKGADRSVFENSLAAAGGYIQEIFSAYMGPENVKFKERVSMPFSSNMMKSDVVHIFSDSHSIELDPLLQELDESLTGSTLEETSKALQDFYNKNFAPMEDAFVVFENTKVRRFSADFGLKGYKVAEPQAFEKLQEFTADLFGRPDLGLNLAGLIRNCKSWASGTDAMYKQATNLARAILSQSIAKLLFDDWNNIGRVGSNAIHFFNLNEVYVPLSYLMESMGRVMLGLEGKKPQYATRFFQVTFVTSGVTMEYKPGSIAKEMAKEKAKGGTASSIKSYWNTQAAEARKGSHMEMRFLKDFTQVILEMAKSLKM